MRKPTSVFRTMSKMFNVPAWHSLAAVFALGLMVLSPSAWAAPGTNHEDLLSKIVDVEDDLAAHDADIKAGVTLIDACGTTITSPGSYKLADSLVCAGSNGITVEADYVTIDLNGHVLSSTTSSYRGIEVVPGGGYRLGITVRNGTVKGFNQGLWLVGKGHIVENLRVIQNASDGIVTGEGCTIRDNVVADNGGNGISTSTAPAIIGNTLRGNGGTAITPQEGATVVNNTASGNGNGFFIRVGSTVIGNTAYQNTGNGMTVICPSNVVGNAVVRNGGNNLELATGVYEEPCYAADNLSSSATLIPPP